jgi:hypothetical protein
MPRLPCELKLHFQFVIRGLTRNPAFSSIAAGVYPLLWYGAGMTPRAMINVVVYNSASHYPTLGTSLYHLS